MQPVSLALLLLIGSAPAHADDGLTVFKKQHTDLSRDLNTVVLSETQTVQSVRSDYSSLRYLVCNLSAKPLIFRWTAPGFEVSLNHPLQQDICAVYQQNAKKTRIATDTEIRYTQSGLLYNSSAFLPDETPDRNTLGEWITYIGERLASEDYSQPDTYYDLKILSINKGDLTENTLSWSDKVETVVIKLVRNDEQALASTDQQLSYKTDIIATRVSISELDEQTIKDDPLAKVFLSGQSIRLQARQGNERKAEFLMPVGKTEKRVSVPVMMLDKQGHIIKIIQLQQ